MEQLLEVLYIENLRQYGLIDSVINGSNKKIVNKIDNYSIIDEDVLLIDCSSKEIVITLPTASTSIKKEIIIKKIDSSNNKVIIIPNTGKIDNKLSEEIIKKNQSLTFIAFDSNWWVV